MQGYVLAEARREGDPTIRVTVLDEEVPDLPAELEQTIRLHFGTFFRIEQTSIGLVLYLKQHVKLDELWGKLSFDELLERLSNVVYCFVRSFNNLRRPAAPPKTVRVNAAMRGAH